MLRWYKLAALQVKHSVSSAPLQVSQLGSQATHWFPDKTSGGVQAIQFVEDPSQYWQLESHVVHVPASSNYPAGQIKQLLDPGPLHVTQLPSQQIPLNMCLGAWQESH